MNEENRKVPRRIAQTVLLSTCLSPVMSLISLRKYILFKLRQFINTSLPTSFIFFPIVILSSFLQL